MIDDDQKLKEQLLERKDIWGPGGNSEDYETARWHRDVLLRRRQFEVAMEGDALMLVWLGLQYLGQTINCTCGKKQDPLASFLQAIRASTSADTTASE